MLYTPATSAKVLRKAIDSRADAVVFDLEDAVSPEEKDSARETLVQFLSGESRGEKEIVVRVNGLNTPWCPEDVNALSRMDIAGLLFPKISTAADVQTATSMMSAAGAPDAAELWCMIETAKAVLNLQAIALMAGEPASRMTVWVLGTNDLAKELHVRETVDRRGLVTVMAMALVTGRAYGLSVLDGVYNGFKDTAGFGEACLQALIMGFDGKTLIHPSQIAECNRAFSPSADDLVKARAIVDVFAQAANRGKGVMQIDGKMVELLHAQMAARTLEVAEEIARLEGLAAG